MLISFVKTLKGMVFEDFVVVEVMIPFTIFQIIEQEKQGTVTKVLVQRRMFVHILLQKNNVRIFVVSKYNNMVFNEKFQILMFLFYSLVWSIFMYKNIFLGFVQFYFVGHFLCQNIYKYFTLPNCSFHINEMVQNAWLSTINAFRHFLFFAGYLTTQLWVMPRS